MATKTTRMLHLLVLAGIGCGVLRASASGADRIPLPEHPRPDFQRSTCQNLNGPWQFQFDPEDQGLSQAWFNKDTQSLTFDVKLPNQRLWSLEDPYLYEVTATLKGKTLGQDTVATYFGMRKISVGDMPGTHFPYVINEWNGYWRYDRSQKFTGLPDIVEGMTIRDFHSPFYIAMERELCSTVRPGQWVDVPLFTSFMTDQAVEKDLTLDMTLFGWYPLDPTLVFTLKEKASR